MELYDYSTPAFDSSQPTKYAEILKFILGYYDYIPFKIIGRNALNTTIYVVNGLVSIKDGTIFLDEPSSGGITYKMYRDNNGYGHFYIKTSYNQVSLYIKFDNLGTLAGHFIIPKFELKEIDPSYTDITLRRTLSKFNRSVDVLSSNISYATNFRNKYGTMLQYHQGMVFGTLMFDASPNSTDSSGSGTTRYFADGTEMATILPPVVTETRVQFLTSVAYLTTASGELKECIVRLNKNGVLTMYSCPHELSWTTTIYVPINYLTTDEGGMLVIDN